MNKIKFSHLEGENGQKVNSIQMYMGNLNLNEWMDDIELEMKIVNNDVEFDILNQHYYDKEELQSIIEVLKDINWDNGYEFFEFYDMNTNESFILIGDKPSSMSNAINSSQNLQNINNVLNAIKF